MFTEKSLAQTYNPPSYADPYDLVEDYRRVAEFHISNPNSGSTAVARALELPRARIRPWLNGSVPDSVRAIQRARKRGWLNASVTSKVGKSLNTLVAACLSGGSVSRSYEPRFVPGSSAVEQSIKETLANLDLGVRELRSDNQNKSTELTPDTDRILLGRALAAIHVPVGTKVNLNKLPEYLHDSPASIRATFAEVYVGNRGAYHKNKDTLGIREERSQLYLKEIASLIEDVTGSSVSIHSNGIVVSAEAARELGLGRDGVLRI